MNDRLVGLKVLALIAGGAAILGGFFYVLGDFQAGPGYVLYVDYRFSGNVHPGAPVKLAGIKVGHVDELELFGGRFDEVTQRRPQVRLKLWLERRAHDMVREDAEFFISTTGVLGEQYVEIVPGSHTRPPLEAGAIVVGVDPPRTDLVVARLYDFLDTITGLIHDDKDVIRDLLVNAASAVRGVDRMLRENHDTVRKLLVDGAGLLGEVRRGKLIDRTAALLDDGLRLTALVDAGKIDKVFAAVDSLKLTLDHGREAVGVATAILTGLKQGKGTAGRLLVREELYADLKEMVFDLKRNPWKLIWKE